MSRRGLTKPLTLRRETISYFMFLICSWRRSYDDDDDDWMKEKDRENNNETHSGRQGFECGERIINI